MKMTSLSPIDLLIVGGGINGAGIACDAAGRGLSVHLCEQADLASGTSSKSSKLIHGGLRYLEYFEFRLVHEALMEREILMRKAPHLIAPLDFVLPHHVGLRPAWLIRFGLFLYDHLSKRTLLPKSQQIHLQQSPYGEPLQSQYQKGFVYPDCWADDARLVIANAIAAREKGATISTYCKIIKLKRENDYWDATVLNQCNQEIFHIHARAVVNATGPWIQQFFSDVAHLHSQHHLRMVKGSHIIVPQLYKGHQAYILQQTDNRVVFVIPYYERFSLIGTTDVDYEGDPHDAKISDDEIAYLCAIVNDYFKQSITAADIVDTFSGVRPLFDNQQHANAQSLSRDYALELDVAPQQAPLLSIFGGKITTYRELAEHALAKLAPFFPHMGKPWTHDAPLPGGDMVDFEAFFVKLLEDYPQLPRALLYRLARQYGTRAYRVLGNVTQIADLGQDFGAMLYEREVVYLRECEWGVFWEDIWERRTHLRLMKGPVS